MNWKTLDNLVGEGRHKMSLYARQLVAVHCADLMQSLDHLGASLFFSPFIFVPNVDSNSVRLALTAQTLAVSGKLSTAIVAHTNELGHVFVPSLGYLKTPIPNGEVSLRANHGAEWLVDVGGTMESLTIEPISCTDPFPFGVIEHSTTLFGNDIIGDDGSQICLTDGCVAKIGAPIEMLQALQQISKNQPHLFSLIETSVDYFVMVDHRVMRSCTTESLPGIVFVAAINRLSIPYFIEEIAHQCGHAIISTISFGKNVFFLEDENTPLSNHSRNPRETRSILVALHGAFTEVISALALYEYLLSGSDVSSDDRLEALGRMTFALKKYTVDKQNVCAITTLTPLGRSLQEFVLEMGDKLLEETVELRAGVNVDQQIYDFDFDQFKLNNGYRNLG
ncbi:hypothetical protein [Sinorhizobium meliloti]|uniref:hypothetical protein n=1 Tax=Rhizobium meliloti TaxID=382 RepID=UPI000FD95AF1|nr:hypothetical protein [Sinorhizobium meliloti]RVN34503.1 hypothetical protein CN118_22440 [Sinorhizobium meliloti]